MFNYGFLVKNQESWYEDLNDTFFVFNRINIGELNAQRTAHSSRRELERMRKLLLGLPADDIDEPIIQAPTSTPYSTQGGNIIPQTISQSDFLELTYLKTSDAEYQTVSQQFLSSLNRTSTIVSIEKITNKFLKIQYEAQLEKIQTLNKQGKNERILWHGTKEDVVIKICNNGFDRGYCGTNGTWHGQGVYFATQSEYSDQDTYTPRDRNGRKHMFMCRVATGLYVQGTQNLKVLPTRPNSVYTYDSAVNRIGAPTVFIIFNDVQAYPAYHITYT